MDLEALVDFNAVALHGGFSQASRATGRPKASLSRRIRKLEDTLGVRLIERGPRTLRLTEEGVALHAQSSVLLDRLDELQQELRGSAGLPKGRLRISAPVSFAQRGLGRLAARYAAAYPDVQLEISVDDHFVDPLREGFDLAIRANPKPTTELAGRCFLRDELIVAAHPSLGLPKARRGTPPVAAVLLLGASDAAPWRIMRGGRSQALQPRASLRLSSMSMVHDAALDGAGMAQLPRSLVQPDLDAGRLVEWGSVVGHGIEVWALYPPRRHVSRKVSAFIGMLTDQFAGGSPEGFQQLSRQGSGGEPASRGGPKR